MLKGMINKVYLAVAVLGLFGGAFGAKVAPLYFESLGNSAAENADSQQEYWEGLMKYKLWGSEGLTFNKHTVHIADKNGYNGTATGDISFFNGAHHVGGPLLSGKGLHLSDDAGSRYLCKTIFCSISLSNYITISVCSCFTSCNTTILNL